MEHSTKIIEPMLVPFQKCLLGAVGVAPVKRPSPRTPSSRAPTMMNIYNGNVATNARGLATVVLPDYFEGLNGEFRYQLTVIGQFCAGHRCQGD